MNILYVVNDNPRILNATSLQLILIFWKEFNISSFVINSKLPESHKLDSSINPCSIPKWYSEIINENEKIKINKTL